MLVAPYIRKVFYYETDQMGIVHHSNYVRWLEECRVDFMDKIDYPYAEVEKGGISLAVLDVQCEYKSMVRFGDTVRITMEIEKLSHSRMSILYRVYDSPSDELRCVGKSSHCFYHNETHKPVALGKHAPELYQKLAAMQRAQDDQREKNL